MIKGVIFDMDGLMFDTESLAIPAIVKAARARGFQMEEKQVYNVMGKNINDSQIYFKSVFGEGFDYSVIQKEKQDIMFDYMEKNGIPLMSGLRELLSYLHNNGIRMTVATSTDKNIARRYFEMADIAGYFPDFVSGDMVIHSKPHPQIYELAADMLSLPCGECMALEDSPAGIESAYRAGMCPVMVPDKIAPDKKTRSYAHSVVKSLQDIPDIIFQINK